MPVYDVWVSEDQTETTLAMSADHTRSIVGINEDIDGQPMVLVASFWARNWSQAKKDYVAIIDAIKI